jgi:hypothetical protein
MKEFAGWAKLVPFNRFAATRDSVLQVASVRLVVGKVIPLLRA